MSSRPPIFPLLSTCRCNLGCMLARQTAGRRAVVRTLCSEQSRGSSREDCKQTRDIRKSLKYLFNLSLFISTDSSPFNYSVIAL